MWLELELDASGEDVRIRSRGSRGERAPMVTLPPEQGFDALKTFANKVARAVRGGKATGARSVCPRAETMTRTGTREH